MFSKGFIAYDYRFWTAVLGITVVVLLLFALFSGSVTAMASEYDNMDDAGNPIVESDKEIPEEVPRSFISQEEDPKGFIVASEYEWLTPGAPATGSPHALRLSDDGGVDMNFVFETTDDLTIDFHWRYHSGNGLAYMWNAEDSQQRGFRAFTGGRCTVEGIIGDGMMFRNPFGGDNVNLSHLSLHDGEWYHIRVVLDSSVNTYTVYIDGEKKGEEYYDGSGFDAPKPFRVMGRRSGSEVLIDYDRYVWARVANHDFHENVFSRDLQYDIVEGEGSILYNKPEAGEHRVNFDLNLGTEEDLYQTVYVPHLSFVSEPIAPRRIGQEHNKYFKGWYMTPEAAGISFFSRLNNFGFGSHIRGPVTLYAGWIQEPISDRDHFSFGNRGTNFSTGLLLERNPHYPFFSDDRYIPHIDRPIYKIHDEYKTLLTKDVEGERKANISDYILRRVNDVFDREFKGACHGMGVTMALIKDGQLELGIIDEAACCTNKLNPPIYYDETGKIKVDGDVESTIIFYQMAQYLPHMSDASYSNKYENRPSNQYINQDIVDEVRSTSSNFTLISVSRFDEEGNRQGGHLVIGYDLESREDQYIVHLWESNNIERDWSLEIEKDSQGNAGAKATIRSETDQRYNGLSTTDGTMRINRVISLDDAYGDYNLQELLNLEKPLIKSQVLQKAKFSQIILTTNYHSFIIEDQVGNKTTVEGINVEGDIDISEPYGSEFSFKEKDPINTYYLQDNTAYTITPLSDQELYKTTILYNDSFITSSAIEKSQVEFNPCGKTEVKSDDTGSVIRVTSTINEHETPWYKIDVYPTGEEASQWQDINLEPAADEAVIRSSESLGEFTVVASNLNNDLELDIETLEDTVIVKNTIPVVTLPPVIETLGNIGKDNMALYDKNDNLLKHTEVTYAVSFRTYGGEPVDNIDGVSYNSTIDQPDDPTFGGYLFDGWYQDEKFEEKWNYVTDTVVEDTTLYAKWITDEGYFHDVNFIVEGHDNLVITVRDQGSIENMPAVPQREGYIGYWDKEKEDLSNIQADVTIKAIYEPGHEVQLLANPEEGGEVYGGGVFETGEEVTIEAIAAEGYEFINWTEGGTEISTDSSYTFTVTSHRLIVANFERPASSDANLSALAVNPGLLEPSFDKATTTYTVGVAYSVNTIEVAAVLSDSNASLTIDGIYAESGEAMTVFLGEEGLSTQIDIVITAEDGETKKAYTVNVKRLVSYVEEINLIAGPPNWQFKGEEITFKVDVTKGNQNAEFAFWYRLPGGDWVNAKEYSTENTWTASTSYVGKATVGVQARTKGSDVFEEARDMLDYKIVKVAPVEEVELSADPEGSQQAGEFITFTAEVTAGNPDAEFAFYYQLPGDNWTLGRSYQQDNIWEPRTSYVGEAKVGVIARAVGSDKFDEARAELDYEITTIE